MGEGLRETRKEMTNLWARGQEGRETMQEVTNMGQGERETMQELEVTNLKWSAPGTMVSRHNCACQLHCPGNPEGTQRQPPTASPPGSVSLWWTREETVDRSLLFNAKKP